MTLHIEIPDEVTQALRLPPQQQKQQLLIELAVSLYSQNILSFGKARLLADLGKREFLTELTKRGIQRHYSLPDLEEDIAYARSE